MGWQQVQQPGQVPVGQPVLAVHSGSDFAVDCYGVCCFCRCFVAVQALVQLHAHFVLLLNATQKTHNPVLFRLNVLLQYVHSSSVRNLQDYKKSRNVVFPGAGAAIQSHVYLKSVPGKPSCDAFHSIRMQRFQPVLQPELHHDVHAEQFLPLYA